MKRSSQSVKAYVILRIETANPAIVARYDGCTEDKSINYTSKVGGSRNFPVSIIKGPLFSSIADILQTEFW